ncbi:gamma-butyrobetaine hydroxylase-like domain-containing protein [Thalassotalea euphylliae]|uniref:DUF971 domain-containing protein n=1 Tax=Thalassotalea euphylliae TaxID=1655234 RepID=A0A3E0U357_9GAMM|nr:gamma-butyrobetaine hydroxylase-like domain-containing protein [Thalassotalea euphylliae]REL31027.1 DUF971 domain-containing protein [Thalassotalea euphylliae]
MLSIVKFQLNHQHKQLTVALSSKSDEQALTESWQFSYEFLRVLESSQATSAFAANASGNPKGKAPALATHKKDVVLTCIEAVGKHGYRLLFDDDYQVIYSEAQFALFHQQADHLWQGYLQHLSSNGHSRDAMIDIKQL